jgi:hypothetical protein
LLGEIDTAVISGPDGPGASGPVIIDGAAAAVDRLASGTVHHHRRRRHCW